MSETQSPKPSTPAQTAPTPADDRTPLGRFARGNKGGPGNPHARAVALLKKAALKASTEEEMAQFMVDLRELGRQGNMAAAKLFLQYTLGQPSKATDPDRVDVDEWQLVKESAVAWAEWVPMMENCLPASVVCDDTRTTWPLIQGDLATKLCNKAARREARKAERSGPTPSTHGSNGGKAEAAAASRPSTHGANGGGGPEARRARPSAEAFDDHLDAIDRLRMLKEELPSIVNLGPFGPGAPRP